jgi:hypothetical protein
MKRIAVGLIGLMASSAAFADINVKVNCWEEDYERTVEGMHGLFSGTIPMAPKGTTLVMEGQLHNPITEEPRNVILHVGKHHHHHSSEQRLTVAVNGPIASFNVEAMIKQSITQKREIPQSTPAQSPKDQFQGKGQYQQTPITPQFEDVTIEELAPGSYTLNAPSSWKHSTCEVPQQQQQQQQQDFTPIQSQMDQAQDSTQPMEQQFASTETAPDKIKVKMHDNEHKLLEADSTTLHLNETKILSFHHLLHNITAKCEVTYMGNN